MINRVGKILITRKRQLTSDYDSNILLGVLLLVCHKAQ
jgi:hypothetical protein